MSSPQTTPLSELLGKEREEREEPRQIQQSQQFANPPPPSLSQMGLVPGPDVSQGISMPKKEFFGMKEVDWKTAFLVFAIVLITSSGMFASCVKPIVPGSMYGQVNIISSLLAAVIGTILFVVIKLLGKF